MTVAEFTTRPARLAAALAACGLVFGAAAAAGQDLTVVPPVSQTYQPKTTAWGEPDLRGTWPIDHLNFTQLQRDPKYGDRAFLTDAEYAEIQKTRADQQSRYAAEEKTGKLGMGHWVEAGTANRRTSLLIAPRNGRLPELTARGKQLSAAMRSSYRAGQTFDWVTDFDTWDRCITRGLPASMFPFNYNNGIRIFQSPGQVAIQLEMVHETRIIPTDGRPPLPAQLKNWLGESRGHWEHGNTLVVETSNLKTEGSATNVGTWGSPRNNDTPISNQARVVERFIMTGPDTIEYEVTYSDPVMFTAPWTARLDWKRNDRYQIFEYACHEGDEQIRDYITSSRAQRAKAAAECKIVRAAPASYQDQQRQTGG
jgi:hypothetical protein